MTALDRRLHAARPDLADLRLRGAVEAARFAAGSPRRVTAPSCPVRRAPGPDAPLDTEALMGEAVLVFDEAEGWAWTQIEDGYVGYLPAAALGEPGPAPTHRVAALRTFVYPAPDLKRPPLAMLSLGAGVAVVGREGGYARLAEGGHVFGGHLAPLGEPEPDWVAVAARFVGVPYLWGGKTSLGLDCSGLVQLSLAQAGIAAPRDADLQQAGLGRPLGPEAGRDGPEAGRDRPEAGRDGLRRGDLVFWRGHVGIMVDGAHLLHANGHHMAVAIEPLAAAEARILANSYGPVIEIRRLD